ncbi:hypothetical protein [Haloprofundus marisrubri]|uniref:hypothetical protein n=1 Tax=Haloprofundus marisrubri TaxID=1514971 RepID=UPI0012BAF6D5|nr:hypothetical protein [Haloprofundus marisrubri]
MLFTPTPSAMTRQGSSARAERGSIPDGGVLWWSSTYFRAMRDEAEIREQYEFLKTQLEDEEMRHERVRQMFTYYKRALGWVLEEEHI